MSSLFDLSKVSNVTVGALIESRTNMLISGEGHTLMVEEKMLSLGKNKRKNKSIECFTTMSCSSQCCGNGSLLVTTHGLGLQSACRVMQEIQYLCSHAVLYKSRERM